MDHEGVVGAAERVSTCNFGSSCNELARRRLGASCVRSAPPHRAGAAHGRSQRPLLIAWRRVVAQSQQLEIAELSCPQPGYASEPGTPVSPGSRSFGTSLASVNRRPACLVIGLQMDLR
jgi:hypothetical protein